MYKIRFNDNSEFTGGEPQDSKWNEMPDKLISSWHYSFLDVSIGLKGFESYNHILEKVVVLNSKEKKISKPAHRISKIILMAKWKNRVYEVVYDLDRSRVYQQVEAFGKEYIDKDISVLGKDIKAGQATTGWRRGDFDPEIHPKIRRY